MPIGVGIRRGAVIAIACLAVALISGSAQVDVPEEPRLAVVDDGPLPLSADGDVLVADLDGIELATTLAEAIGPRATVLDLSPLTDPESSPDPDTLEQLVAQVRDADVVVVTDRERPDVEAPADPATPEIADVTIPDGALRSCRPLVTTWIAGLGAPTLVITDVLPAMAADEGAGEADEPAASELAASEAPDESMSGEADEAEAAPSYVYLLAATVEDETLAALLTGAVRASGEVPTVEDAVEDGTPDPSDCPGLPEPPPSAPEPEPSEGPEASPEPEPSAVPEPSPSDAPEPSPEPEPSAVPEPSPSSPPAPEPSPQPSSSTPPRDTPDERVDTRAPEQRTPWRLPVRELPAASTLGLSVDTTGVDLDQVRVAEDRIRLSGELTGIAVVDRRGDETHGWTLSAQVSDLVGPGRLSADHLGWTPRVDDERALAGPRVDSALSGGPGLALPAVLGTAPRGTGGKPLAVDAELVLETARDAPPGAYAGTITLTLFPIE